MKVPDTVSSTDGVTIKVHDLGGDGPPLLLCHATGFCGPMWGPVAAILGRRYTCVTFDYRAHGQSTRPIGREMVWQGMAEDILAVVDALDVDEPLPAVGHSMGGATLAIAQHLRPGTFSKVWTFEPILFDRSTEIDRGEPSEISEGARRRRADFANRAEVVERYGSRPPLNVLDPRTLQAYADHGFRDTEGGTVTLACRPEDEASVFEHHNSGARQVIGELTIPFLVAASGDGQRPAEAVKAAAAEFDSLELAVYDELTHFGPLEDPDRLAVDILAWLDRPTP